MKHSPSITTETAVPVWRTVHEGRRILEELVDDFVASAAKRRMGAKSPADAMALKVTAGAGKTRATLRSLARHGKRLLKRGHVLFYLPTLDLAERAARDFQAIAPHVPCVVIRGRQAMQPGSRVERMCSRHELVAKISAIVPSVTEVLCRAELDDGTPWQSPCAAGCGYLAQMDAKGAKITFLSHAYLRAWQPIDPDHKVALRIVDEKVWSTLSGTNRISLDEFMRAPSPAFPRVLRPGLVKAKSAIVEGLHLKVPLNRFLRTAGIPQSLLVKLKKAESGSREDSDIRPGDGEATVHDKLNQFDMARLRASLTREAIFSTLGADRSDSFDRISFCEEVRAGETRQIIKIHRLTPLPRGAPVLLLDADADRAITERLAPGARFEAIDIAPGAEVIQVEDRTLSNTWLLDNKEGPGRRRMILDLIAREVQRAGERGVLVVASKTVLAKLHADVGQPIAADPEFDLLKPIRGASPRWFGPRMQGVNGYEDFATIVIVGRLQPPPVAIEDAARCIFGDEAEPFVEHGLGPLPVCDTLRLMASDELVPAKFRSHPDERGRSILRQMRECHSLQAIARLRLVAPKHPKRVIILSSLPLPGFPVTRLIPFKAVCRGLEADPDPRGFLRLEAALRATMGQTVVGARLSEAGLVSDLPADFESKGAAHNFRRGRTTQQLVALAQRIATANEWPLTVLDLRRTGGGKPVVAVLLCEAGEANARAQALWPALSPSLASARKILPVR